MSAQRADERPGLVDGEAAVPRRNGELVFEAPWEGRAFGLAVALSDQGSFTWEAFRSRLIAEIGEAERCGAETTYYERWLAALESVLTAEGFLSEAEVARRAAEYLDGTRDDDDHDHDHENEGAEHVHASAPAPASAGSANSAG